MVARHRLAARGRVRPATMLALLALGAASCARDGCARPRVLDAIRRRPRANPVVAVPAPDVRETGSHFSARILSLVEVPRERAIFAAVASGSIPSFVRPTCPVRVEARGHHGEFYASCDYVGVGVEDDWLRTPMRPTTAQRVADALGALLPTRRMVNAIYEAASVRVPFVPLRPRGEAVRGSTALFIVHHANIEHLLRGRAGLVAGQKKDVVVGACAQNNPGRVVIYGGWYPHGTLVQALSYIHSAAYVDYSHGIRLIAPEMLVDGQRRRVIEVLADPELSALVSDEGPVTSCRYERH